MCPLVFYAGIGIINKRVAYDRLNYINQRMVDDPVRVGRCAYYPFLGIMYIKIKVRPRFIGLIP